MAVQTPDDLRQTDRKRVLKGAKIAYAARCASLPCVVRDISSTGARLQVKDHGAVPETFELLIEIDGFEVEVEVVWRRNGEVGVIFLDEPVITNPKRHQVVSSSAPKARGTLRRVKTTGARRSTTTESHAEPTEGEPAATQDALRPVDQDIAIETPLTVDDQVDALKVSLQTLEIVAGEDTLLDEALPTDATSLAVEQTSTPDDECLAVVDATARITEDQSVEIDEIPAGTDLTESVVEASLPSDASVTSETESFVDIGDVDTCSGVIALDIESGGTSELDEDVIAADNATDTIVPYAEAATLVTAEDDSAASRTHNDETLDAPTMDQNFVPLDCDEAMDALDEASVDSCSETPDVSAAPEYTSWDIAAAREEVPMFRDAAGDSAVPMMQSDTAAAAAETMQTAQDVVAPTVAEVESAQPVTAPLQSRIETALQAPACAADNLVQPLMPIAPAPHPTATVPDLPEAEDIVAETPVELAPAAPILETSVSDTVESVATEDAPTCATDIKAADVASTSMRPELAAFVSMFATPMADAHACPEPDTVATTDAAELPATTATAGAPCVDNVLAFANAQSEPATLPQFDTAPEITIIEDAIVIDAAPVQVPVEAPEPVFCEMQLAPVTDTTAMDAPIEPSAPLVMEEILPCADEDDYVAPASVEADVLAVVGPVEHAPVETASVAEAAMPVAPAMPDAPEVAPAKAQNIPILVAEDDVDDRLFMREAFDDSEFDHDISFVENGEELLAYLNGEGKYADSPKPGLILLDLNMPKMDGRTALLHIKSNPSLRRIPVIVLTTSNSEDDIEKTYDLGVSSYISKPSSAKGLKEVITTLNGYWSNLVALPTCN